MERGAGGIALSARVGTAHDRRVTVIPYGPNAWLLRFAEQVGDASFKTSRAIAASLESKPPVGLREFVCGYTTVLLIFGEPTVEHQSWDIEAAVKQLRSAARKRPRAAAVKEIPVTYDGPDLERVAKHNSLSVDEVVKIHSGTVYKVHLLGFAPGFPYLGELDPRLHTPRLETPRTTVPAGSVAIGGEQTGVYSIPNPGGWNLIGHTNVKLFDPDIQEDREKFFLQPSDRVQFIPIVAA